MTLMRNENEWHSYTYRAYSAPRTRRLNTNCTARQRAIAAAALIALTAACSSTASPVQATPPSFPADTATGPYPVVKIIDGDTITVRRDRTNLTVRLLGIDTPEVKDPRKPVQCFGKEASAETRRILTGQRVYLESDPGQDQVDRYGRTLAYAWTTDHTLVNLHLVDQGFAHEYTYGAPYKYQPQFRAAQDAAQTAGRGLWAGTACP